MPVPALELATSGPNDTRAFAAALAPLLRAGDVVALSGDLGAGKTCFVQGAARGLGVEDRVTSPTFVLVRHYEGRLPIVHCDVYRLNRLQDVHDLGDDVLAPDVVTFLEWADAVRPLLPDDRLEVEINVPTAGETNAEPVGDVEVVDDEDRRTAALRGFGPGWTERADALIEAVRPWLTGASREAANELGGDADPVAANELGGDADPVATTDPGAVTELGSPTGLGTASDLETDPEDR